MCTWKPVSERMKHSVVYYGGSNAPSIDNPFVRNHILVCSKGNVSLPQSGRLSDVSCLPPRSSGTVNTNVQEALLEDNVAAARMKAESSEQSLTGYTFPNTGVLEASIRQGGTAHSDRWGEQAILVGGTKDSIAPKARHWEDAACFDSKMLAPGLGPITLVEPSKDKDITASIDCVVIGEMSLCHYDPMDDIGRVRFDAGFPGMSCRHCRKKWFYDNAGSWARAIPRIEEHILSCRRCPAEVKDDIRAAKSTQEEERARLRAQNGEDRSWGTRRHYASLVWKRLRCLGR